MCGLVGCMGGLSVAHERAFMELLSVDVVRGHHSTGMASYNSNTKNINIAKEVGSPPELLKSSDWTKAMSQVNRLLLGHNRYATKGKITKENAHPFKQGHIIGAHNGSITSMCQARLEDKDHKFETDSEAIMWSISTRGFDETWKILANPVFDTSNAFALTWFDANSNKFYLVRNKKRPLFYAYTEKDDAIFWASELGALQWIMYRNGYVGKDFKAYSVNEDTLYEWDIVKSADDKVSTPKLRKLDIPEPLWVPATTTYYPNSSTTMPFDFDQSERNQHRSHQNNNSNNVITFPTLERVNNFRPPYKTDKGFVIGKKFALALADQGCFYCGEKNFKWGEFAFFPTFGTSNTTEFLCKECYTDNDIKQLVADCSNA